MNAVGTNEAGGLAVLQRYCALAVAAVGLAACNPMPAGMTEAIQDPSPFEPLTFACPPSGTTVTHWNARPLIYAGPASDPEVCLVRGMTRTEQRLFLVLGAPDAAPALQGEATMRAALRALWPLAPMKTVEFTITDAPRFGTRLAVVRERWRVLKAETVMLSREPRPSVVVERSRVQLPDQSPHTIWTYWIDRETRAVLRTDMRVVRGVVVAEPEPSLQPQGLSM